MTNRYTYLNTEEYEAILTRLIDRLQEKEVGIRFDEFKDFCLFLNSLDDFQVSLNKLRATKTGSIEYPS